MAGQGQNFVRVQGTPIAFAALLKRSDLRSRSRHSRGWDRIQGVARSFAHEFETSTDFELGEQGRDVKLNGALGKIQFVGNFLVGQAAEDTVQDFLFAAREANGALGAMARFEKFLGFFRQATQAIGGSRNHNEIVARVLSTNHAVHGEQAGGMVNREFSGGSGLDVEMGRAGAFLVKEIDAGCG